MMLLRELVVDHCKICDDDVPDYFRETVAAIKLVRWFRNMKVKYHLLTLCDRTRELFELSYSDLDLYLEKISCYPEVAICIKVFIESDRVANALRVTNMCEYPELYDPEEMIDLLISSTQKLSDRQFFSDENPMFTTFLPYDETDYENFAIFPLIQDSIVMSLPRDVLTTIYERILQNLPNHVLHRYIRNISYYTTLF